MVGALDPIEESRGRGWHRNLRVCQSSVSAMRGCDVRVLYPMRTWKARSGCHAPGGTGTGGGLAFACQGGVIADQHVAVLAEVELEEAEVVDVYYPVLVEVGRGIVLGEMGLDMCEVVQLLPWFRVNLRLACRATSLGHRQRLRGVGMDTR